MPRLSVPGIGSPWVCLGSTAARMALTLLLLVITTIVITTIRVIAILTITAITTIIVIDITVAYDYDFLRQVPLGTQLAQTTWFKGAAWSEGRLSRLKIRIRITGIVRWLVEIKNPKP